MEPKHIVVIETGSSGIRGAAAAVDATSGITLLAVEEAPAADSVRYGRVQNAREASARIDEIIRRLENNPAVAPASVSAVFIANGGRSLSSAASEATVGQTADSEVTPTVIERLRNEARYNLGTDRDIIAVFPRRYFVDNAEVKNVVGSFGRNIRGEFTFVTCSPENLRNLQRVKVSSHEREIPREFITRLEAQCAAALTDSDRQLGCVFLDFGAETTTMAVFRDGAMQMAAALPMGSRNITRDLSVGLSITEESAEDLKITKGQAVNERANIDAPDAQTREIINFVSARVGEIVANVVNRLTQEGFKPAELPAGIVVEGRGSRLEGFIETLEAQTRMKVRRAAVDRSIRSVATDIKPADYFDLVSLVQFAATRFDLDCLTLPVEIDAAAAAGPSVPGSALRPGRRVVAEDDPHLLDDEDDLDSPVTVNEEDDDELPPPDPSPEVTRRNLLERLKNWIAPKAEDDNLDDEEDE